MMTMQTTNTDCNNTWNEPFPTENELIETVLSGTNLRQFLPRRGEDFEPVATREFPIGMGKVDIVLGAANPSSLASRMQRQNRTPTPIAGIEAVVLSCLFVKRGLTIETVARRSGLGKKDIEHALVKLVEWELCSQPTTTTYLRSPLSNQFAYLVSIEGKLTNWRKALEQASRNRLFASYSYVVMDARRAKPAIERNALFRAHGVGLAVACAKTQSVEIICRPIPPHKPVSDVFSVIAKEALTARVLKREVFLSENFTHALSAQH